MRVDALYRSNAMIDTSRQVELRLGRVHPTLDTLVIAPAQVGDFLLGQLGLFR